MISHFRRLLRSLSKTLTLGGKKPRMFWINILLWIVIGLLVAIVVIHFGSRSTWRLIESLSAKRSIQGSISENPIARSSDSGSSKLSNANKEEPQAPNSDEQIKDKVLKKQFESINIGGAVVLVQTLPNASEEEVAIIFNQVKDKKALVNLALDGKVRIKKVKLITISRKPPNRKFAVLIVIKNQTGEDIEVKIPKGQIFENRQLRPRRQNLAAANEGIITIPASSDDSSPGMPITIEALCINKGFDYPNGSSGNITIFELNNKSFADQKDLWEWIEGRLDESRSSRHLIRRY